MSYSFQGRNARTTGILDSKGLGRNNVITPDNKRGRPTTVLSVQSEESEDEEEVKKTSDQHQCINNLGMGAAFLTPCGVIACIVAIGTQFWFVNEGNDIGLFQYCNNWTKACGMMSDYNENSTTIVQMTWKVGVPLELTGAGLLLIGMITLICYPCHRKVNCSKISCGISIAIILAFGTVILLAGTAMFVSHYFSNQDTYTLNWSFYCASGGAVIVLMATVLFVVHVIYTGCFK